VVSGSKHVTSEFKGFLSLSPPCLQFVELSSLVSFEGVRYPIVCWRRHTQDRVNGEVVREAEYGTSAISHLGGKIM
jgi:hypothetical protein